MSFDASRTLEIKRFGPYEVILWAGSYNPGNQPEYGEKWEYFIVTVTKKDIFRDTIEEEQFDDETKSKKHYKKMIDKYKNKTW